MLHTAMWTKEALQTFGTKIKINCKPAFKERDARILGVLTLLQEALCFISVTHSARIQCAATDKEGAFWQKDNAFYENRTHI